MKCAQHAAHNPKFEKIRLFSHPWWWYLKIFKFIWRGNFYSDLAVILCKMWFIQDILISYYLYGSWLSTWSSLWRHCLCFEIVQSSYGLYFLQNTHDRTCSITFLLFTLEHQFISYSRILFYWYHNPQEECGIFINLHKNNYFHLFDGNPLVFPSKRGSITEYVWIGICLLRLKAIEWLVNQ